MMIGTYTTWYDSSITPWSTFCTLIFVISIYMAKEGFEDYKRHQADRRINHQIAHHFYSAQDSNSLSDTIWKSLRVGNLVKVYENEEIPADLLLLTSSEAFGNAYVETANIDGESNLKLKTSVKTGDLGPFSQDIDDWLRLVVLAYY